VKAGKAYISSLGTTGLLIASSVLLLLVVGTIFAYDRWPDDDPGRAHVVAIGDGEAAVRARTVSAERRRAARARASARRRAAAANRRRARAKSADANATEGRWADSTPLAEPVLSDLPAPDSDGLAGQAPGAGGSPAGDQNTRHLGAGSGGGGGETTRHLGDAVSSVSPQAGSAIGEVGSAVDQAVGVTAPSLHP
jgi:hypothetical protein